MDSAAGSGCSRRPLFFKMIKHYCRKCVLRAAFDRNPGSIISRLWRWHIGFCPGWKRYLASLPEEERAGLEQKYARPGS